MPPPITDPYGMSFAEAGRPNPAPSRSPAPSSGNTTNVIPGSEYVEPDPAVVDGFNVNNVILGSNNRRYPTFKDPETAKAYETGLRNFMRYTGRTDTDPYGFSGMFYQPGRNRLLGREGGRFGNEGMTQRSIDAINRLAYNQYLGLKSGIGFRKGGKGDPVKGYAPALKLGSDTPGGKVVAAPQINRGGLGSFLPPMAGLFEGLFGSPNTTRTLDNMGVDYSNMGVDAAMIGTSPNVAADPVQAAVEVGIPTIKEVTSLPDPVRLEEAPNIIPIDDDADALYDLTGTVQAGAGEQLSSGQLSPLEAVQAQTAAMMANTSALDTQINQLASELVNERNMTPREALLTARANILSGIPLP